MSTVFVGGMRALVIEKESEDNRQQIKGELSVHRSQILDCSSTIHPRVRY